jgi:ribonuclease G
MSKEIIINSNPQETRVAVVEDDLLTEIYIEREKQRGIVGNIYKGRVTKVLPGMQSAFVNIGLDRDAFLYVADVIDSIEKAETSLEDEEGLELGMENGGGAGALSHIPHQPHSRNQSIDELLREGQEILVQVAKEPIAGKGARITTHITLPGRYLVYMPTVEHVGVSRRIEDEAERTRLRELTAALKGQDEGFIVRTAGEGKDEEDFGRDVTFLKKIWDEIHRKAESRSAPAVIHRDLGLVQRTLRDVFSADFSVVWVDTENAYEECVEFMDRIQPELVNRIRLYSKDYPIFEEYGIQLEIEKSLRSKVWLKSGGYIVINQTEALVAIDVNTGKYVGKKRLEDTVVRTNLEAVKAIVRQIRLRDLGGIIILDFIDMEEKENQARVLEALENELKSDRSRTKLLQISDFGLVEITRKRVKQSLERLLCQPCPYCMGSGRIKSETTICYDIQRELLKSRTAIEGKHLIVRANPAVARVFREDEYRLVQDLEEILGSTITVKSDDNLHHEQFDVAAV